MYLLCDFCLSPPPPENPAILFGLSPPGISRPPLVPTLNPKNFEWRAPHGISLQLGLSMCCQHRCPGLLDVSSPCCSGWYTRRGWMRPQSIFGIEGLCRWAFCERHWCALRDPRTTSCEASGATRAKTTRACSRACPPSRFAESGGRRGELMLLTLVLLS